MFDGNSSFYDLYEMGVASPFLAWRGAGTKSAFDQGVINGSKRISPMPIKADLVPYVGSIHRSPVVT